MQNYKLVLASASPRRSDILKKAGFKFEIIPSDYEEVLSDLDFSLEKIENLAFQKAYNVLKETTGLEHVKILGADTVVVLNNKILGKPKNKNVAFNMLKSLSGKTHFVVTSVCIIDSITKLKSIKSTISYVTFKNVSDEQIISYIEEFKPFDKAGAYGIQELPSYFIDNIEGSYENIVGLCPNTVIELLKEQLA